MFDEILGLDERDSIHENVDRAGMLPPDVQGVTRDHDLRVFDESARRCFEQPPHAVIR